MRTGIPFGTTRPALGLRTPSSMSGATTLVRADRERSSRNAVCNNFKRRNCGLIRYAPSKKNAALCHGPVRLLRQVEIEDAVGVQAQDLGARVGRNAGHGALDGGGRMGPGAFVVGIVVGP